MQYFKCADADGFDHYLQRESILYMDLLDGKIYVERTTSNGKCLVPNIDFSMSEALTTPIETDASIVQSFLNKMTRKNFQIIKGGKKR